MDDRQPILDEDDQLRKLGQGQFIIVQIPRDDVFDEVPADLSEGSGPVTGAEKKSSWLKRRISQAKPKKATIPIRMTKAEFQTYFAKNEKTGQYREGVVEPPEGRKAWLQKRLPENDPEVWDATLRSSRMLASTRGVGYLGGIANPYNMAMY